MLKTHNIYTAYCPSHSYITTFPVPVPAGLICDRRVVLLSEIVVKVKIKDIAVRNRNHTTTGNHMP